MSTQSIEREVSSLPLHKSTALTPITRMNSVPRPTMMWYA